MAGLLYLCRGALNHFLKFGEKFPDCFGKKLIFFPDQIHVGIQRRVKGTEAEAAVSGYVDDLVQGKCIAKTFFYHQGSIEKQVSRWRSPVFLTVPFSAMRSEYPRHGYSG